jgi:hypothetical protein
MTTDLRTSDGRFICHGILLDATTLVVPDVATAYWYRGARLDRSLKRSRRHRYEIFDISAIPGDRETTFARKVTGRVRATGQFCDIIARGTLRYPATVDKWVWSSDGAYRLSLDVDADPRLNGCAVILANDGAEDDGALIGMVIAPYGFTRKLQCIPVDLFFDATKPCYESVKPALCINVLGGAAFHKDYGAFEGGPEVFREYDLRAEIGKDTVLRTKRGGTLIVRGTKGHGRFAPLQYEPAIEIGQFMFSSSISGHVECVSELLTAPQRRMACDLVSTSYQNRILVGIGDVPITNFASLLRACRSVHSTVRWADGRIEDILPHQRGDYGTPLSAMASLWFGDGMEKKVGVEEQVQDQTDADDDTRSCIDECEGFSQ